MNRHRLIQNMIMMGGKQPWYVAGSIPLSNVLAAFKPKGANDYAHSKVNLVSPGTNDAVDGAAFPTWDAANGWTFVDGSSQYLTVGLGAIATVEPISFVCRFNLDTNNTNYMLMSICNTATFDFFLMWAKNSSVLNANVGKAPGTQAGAETIATMNATTWYTGSCIFSSDASRSVYLDGINKITDVNDVGPGVPNITYIGTYNGGAGRDLYLDGKIAACAFYNIALSDAQVLAVHNAMIAAGL